MPEHSRLMMTSQQHEAAEAEGQDEAEETAEAEKNETEEKAE